MISLNLRIINPWSNGHFTNFWNKSWLPFTNKAIELEVLQLSHTIFEVQINITVKCSHAGLQCELGILGYCICFNFYDTRHWDYDTNTWETYD